MKRSIVCTVDRRGICLKSDDEIIRGALIKRSRQLEHILSKRKFADKDERKALQDEYERTFALTEKFRK